MTIIVSPAPSGRRAWSLIDSRGVEHALSEAAGFIVERGLSGAWSPEIEPVRHRSAFSDGVAVARVDVGERRLSLPVFVRAESPAGLRDRLEQVVSWLDTRDGAATLRAVNESGDTRDLTVRLADAPSIEESAGARGRGWQRVSLEFVTDGAPYWADSADVVLSYTTGGAARGLIGASPFFPLSLAASSILAQPIVVVPIEAVGAWPTWTVLGPGAELSLRNLTTGEHLTLSDWTIPAGGRVEIDTRPRRQRIHDGSGSRLFSRLDAGSDFWKLTRGENRLQIELDGATAASSVTLRYRRLWWTP